MGLCPSRNTASCKSVDNKAVDKVAGNTKKDAVSAATPLPTHQWRDLLKDAPTTKDADKSKRQGESKSQDAIRPATQSAGKIGEFSGQSKDVEQTRRSKEVFLRSIAGNQGQPGVQHDSVETLKEQANTTSTATFVDTSAYMQLLKDGGDFKKKSKLSSTIRSQGRTDSFATKPDMFTSPSTKKDAEGMRMRWGSALKREMKMEPPPGLTKEHGGPPGLTQQDASTLPRKHAQDDIQAEKLSVDLDLSDPMYWSETEGTGKEQTALDATMTQLRLARKRSNASAHRLGRRPRCSEIRSYVMQDLTYDLDEITAMMLLRLQCFNEQQQIFKPEATGQRRFCIGLKEVGRRVKQSKVSCLVVAPNLEGDATEGGLDDRVREILAVSYEKNIPVIFALSRNRMGQAMGKHVPISVLGVLDATGTEELLKTAVKLSRGAREAWLKKKCSKN